MCHFACSSCGRSYYEQRFMWQTAPTDVDDDLAEQISVTSESSEHTTVDMVRLKGAASDFTAGATGVMLMVTVSQVCSLIPFVASSIDLAYGAGLLVTGISTPSGQVNPHKVAKAGIVMSNRVTGLVLMSLACVHPLLLVAALSVDVSAIGMKCFVDATVPGLCPDCRTCRQPVEDAVEEVKAQKHPLQQYEPLEALLMMAFGSTW